MALIAHDHEFKRAQVERVLDVPLELTTVYVICQNSTVSAQKRVHALILQYRLVRLQPTALRTALFNLRRVCQSRVELLRSPSEWDELIRVGFNQYTRTRVQRRLKQQLFNSWDERLRKFMVMIDTDIVTAIFPEAYSRSRAFEYLVRRRQQTIAYALSRAAPSPALP